MRERCASCNGWIFGAGESFLQWKVCDQECALRFRSALVDRYVPKQVVDQFVRSAFEAPCTDCGRRTGNGLYTAETMSAFILFYQIRTRQRVCCSRCGRSNRLWAAIHCLFAGWWGPTAALINLYILPKNLIAAALIKRPTEPSEGFQRVVKASMAESLAPQIMAALAESRSRPSPAAPASA